jgi:hypothetical protein
MDKEEQNIYEAKKSLDAHIKFLHSLKLHINGSNEGLKARAMWASWCLHQYFNNQLAIDIQNAMAEHGELNKD